MGNFRWLAVAPAGQPEVAVVLMAIPGAPVMDAATAEQVRDLMGKGFAGTLFLTTDDCIAEVERLKARSVEFIDEPAERPYGIDAGFHDPSGTTCGSRSSAAGSGGSAPRRSNGLARTLS